MEAGLKVAEVQMRDSHHCIYKTLFLHITSAYFLRCCFSEPPKLYRVFPGT